MNTLHLTLKAIFFSEIAAGEKPFEYREVKPYWSTRLEGKQFDRVLFKNGYHADAPTMLVEIRAIEKGMFQGKYQYRITLGRILEVTNYEGAVVEGYSLA